VDQRARADGEFRAAPAPRAATVPAMADQEEQDFAGMINGAKDGWVNAMGLVVLRATRDEVIGELTIGPHHLQAYGIVHGGVHAGVAETLASIGAAIHAMAEGKSAVGLENSTSFLRAVRGGKLRGVARPLARGRRSHVWEVDIRDDQGRLAASGKVRLMILDAGAEVAGERVAMAPAKEG
jgi:1,4-dihydroxy-2-naphthoyl-CoA hydrolase